MTKSSSVTKSKSSGGPQSDDGKKIALRNSLKTGAYSKLVVLPNESQQEFDQLVEQFQRDFYPKDAVEMMLVREMAVITWKKLRSKSWSTTTARASWQRKLLWKSFFPLTLCLQI
ncbi:hypothetical protein [Polynucleobacter necessarius]|uniref:hypothetical protein n=1 Tax=Polynucleobacter necessarius TaxID=576610 RepID=UPI000E098B7A|nr:hypothetical protein [Polynucleobacter necessarius]